MCKILEPKVESCESQNEDDWLEKPPNEKEMVYLPQKKGGFSLGHVSFQGRGSFSVAGPPQLQSTSLGRRATFSSISEASVRQTSWMDFFSRRPKPGPNLWKNQKKTSGETW